MALFKYLASATNLHQKKEQQLGNIQLKMAPARLVSISPKHFKGVFLKAHLSIVAEFIELVIHVLHECGCGTALTSNCTI